jgi:hypothetical protein
MQTQKITGPKGKRGVSPATVIAELHFENFGSENRDNGAHLSTNQAGLRHIAHQSDDRKQFEISHFALLSTLDDHHPTE